jgi:hypothetical protein
MKTIKEIAHSYNLSPNSVKKWSVAKRERASTLINMQINPVIMQLVGELHAACFATSNMSNKLVANVYTKEGYGHFDVLMLDSNGYWFVPTTELTFENLQAAIYKIEAIVYA